MPMNETHTPANRRSGRSGWAARSACVATACVAAVLLSACAAEPSAPAKTTSPAPEPTPTETSEPDPPSPEEQRHDAAVAWVDEASHRELAGSVIMASIESTDPDTLHSLMETTGLGGFIVMGSNVPEDPDLFAQLMPSLVVDPDLPPLIAIDEEGGVVTRLPWDDAAGAEALRQGPEGDTEEAFRARAEMLAQAGVSVNFGVVADVTAEPDGFISARTLGDDPDSAAARVAAAVRGEQSEGVATTLKHFPGHGAAPGDSHVTIPQTDKTLDDWRAFDAVPFGAGIDAGAQLLMFGHLQYTQVSAAPASLSPEWYGIARDELGFDGVAVTDDLGMLEASGIPEYQDPAGNVVNAIAAGADLALVVAGGDEANLSGLVDRVTESVDAGDLSEDRLREAAVRDVELRLELADTSAAGE